MYLESIEITFMEPCFADSEKLRLKAVLSRDVTETLPYLNAIIDNAIYSHEGRNLTFAKDFRMITVYPTHITMAKAINTTDAYQVIEWLKERINSTYEERQHITPNYELKKRPSILEILKWLPKDAYNCKVCGELTCVAFALRLWLGEKRVKDCKPISSPNHVESYHALRGLMGTLH